MDGLHLLSIVCYIGASLALNSWELPETTLHSYVNAELNQDWMLFKKSYNKTYEDKNEEVQRRLYWEDTLRFIQEHNLQYDRGESTYSVGENEFADMAEDEYEKIYLQGIILPEVEEEYPEGLTEPGPELPRSIDWRTKGLVSAVKNQGHCGSCWAFSALGALEGQYKKKNGGAIKNLSEQNLVDCANYKWKNYGCRGGWMSNAFRYIQSNRGIDAESCYPYIAVDQSCQFRRSCVEAKNNGAHTVPKSEYYLQRSLATVGPISIAMDVSGRGFSFYKRGVYYSTTCRAHSPNHALLVVGYGQERGRDFWLIKNSWGTKWGDNGYIKVARNKGDRCGVTQFAIYPIV